MSTATAPAFFPSGGFLVGAPSGYNNGRPALPGWGMPVGNTTDLDVLLSMTDLFDFSGFLMPPGGEMPGAAAASPSQQQQQLPLQVSAPLPLRSFDSMSPPPMPGAALGSAGFMAPATASMLADASQLMKVEESAAPAPAPLPVPPMAALAAPTGTRRRTSNKEEQQAKRRERNRVLARKTRLRKKFLFSGLQKQVRQLALENKELKEIVRARCDERAQTVLKDCQTEVPESIVAEMPGEEGGATTLLGRSDFILMKTLQSSQPSFCVTDPLLPDNPIVFASEGFIEMTGYTRQQVLGRNCRFLQGPDTDPEAVAVIRRGIDEGRDTNVLLRNYKADGVPFWNHVFVAALRDVSGRVCNYVGIQHVVAHTPSPEVVEQIKRESLGEDGDCDGASGDAAAP